MEQDTPSDSLIVLAEQMEADLAAICEIMRRSGPARVRKLRDLVEAVEGGGKDQSER